jgi:hypothetical protein
MAVPPAITPAEIAKMVIRRTFCALTARKRTASPERQRMCHLNGANLFDEAVN